MNKVLIAIILLSLSTGFADEQEDLTENQIELLMLRQDIGRDLETAKQYYNTILSSEVDSSQKCDLIQNLETVLTKLDFSVPYYVGRVNQKKLGTFFDDGFISRKADEENIFSETERIQAAVSVFAEKNNCL